MRMSVWRESWNQGYLCITGENDRLAVTIVPQRGGKIISLFDKLSGKEWIHRTDRPWEPLEGTADWGEGDQGGWDEMFPTITPSACPDEGWQHLSFPDHGEVWNRPWRHVLDGEQLQLEIDGADYPYTLRKTISLGDNVLNLRYELENRAETAFSYLWAAHPLLQVKPGMKLNVSPAEGEIQLTYSHHGRLGSLYDYARYPLAEAKDGAAVDLSTLEEASGGHAEKFYFTAPLAEGYARIGDPASGEGLVFRFDPNDVPYLAVWAHYGAFGDYTFAIEPATGYLDSVQEAFNRGKVKRVAGHGIARWQLEVEVEAKALPDGGA